MLKIKNTLLYGAGTLQGKRKLSLTGRVLGYIVIIDGEEKIMSRRELAIETIERTLDTSIRPEGENYYLYISNDELRIRGKNESLTSEKYVINQAQKFLSKTNMELSEDILNVLNMSFATVINPICDMNQLKELVPKGPIY